MRNEKCKCRKRNACRFSITHKTWLLLIVNYYLTSEHVLKEKYKIEEKYGGWSSKNIFELLNRVYDEFLKDNFELILKRYKDPTINFKLLRQYSNDFVKEIIGV